MTDAPSRSSILTQPLGTLGALGVETGGPDEGRPRPGDGRGPGGPGMDRRVGKRRVTPRRLLLAVVLIALVALVAVAWLSRSGGQRLYVEASRLTIEAVEEAPFREYVLVTGTVLPARTVYLDAVVGGQVAATLVEEGEIVTAGQPILRFANDDLALQTLASEDRLRLKADEAQNERLALQRSRLDLAQTLAPLDYDIARLRREVERTRELSERSAIATQEYEALRDELIYAERRRDIAVATHRRDSLDRAVRVAQLNASVGRLRQTYAVVSRAERDLVVRAPAAGQLSLFDAAVGELKTPGARLGQIDVAGAFLVRATVDEFYISRVTPGQRASTTVGETAYELEVRTVFPEVREGQFEVDFVFDGPAPEGVRRGQSLRVRLALSDAERSLVVPRGAFYQSSGGAWMFVVEGDEAVRRDVRLGRQNPQRIEVLDGLAPGERVVTSTYDRFGDAERLVFQRP